MLNNLPQYSLTILCLFHIFQDRKIVRSRNRQINGIVQGKVENKPIANNINTFQTLSNYSVHLLYISFPALRGHSKQLLFLLLKHCQSFHSKTKANIIIFSESYNGSHTLCLINQFNPAEPYCQRVLSCWSLLGAQAFYVKLLRLGSAQRLIGNLSWARGRLAMEYRI